MNAPAQGGAPAKREPSRYDQLKTQLERSKAGFMPLMGNSRDNVEKFCTVVLQAAMDNPELLDADRRSFIASCMRAARDGLMPDGREAVLNIYSTKVKERATNREYWVKLVQYLPMVAGFIKRLYEHPDVELVDAAAVYEKDHFKFIRGDHPSLTHEPYDGMDDPGKIKAAYLVVHLKNGQIKREVMWRRDIEAARGASKAANGPAWKGWYDQQAIKSVIKRGSKQLPRVDALSQIERSDNIASGFGLDAGSVADMKARQMVPQALAYAPSDHLEFGVPEHGEFVVMEGGEDASQAQQHQQADPAGAGEQQADGAGAEASDKPPMPESVFEAESADYKGLITSGRKTVNEVVALLQTRYSLNPDQRMEIASWAAPSTPTGDKP
jgi:recombination protein RecT